MTRFVLVSSVLVVCFSRLVRSIFGRLKIISKYTPSRVSLILVPRRMKSVRTLVSRSGSRSSRNGGGTRPSNLCPKNLCPERNYWLIGVNITGNTGRNSGLIGVNTTGSTGRNTGFVIANITGSTGRNAGLMDANITGNTGRNSGLMGVNMAGCTGPNYSQNNRIFPLTSLFSSLYYL